MAVLIPLSWMLFGISDPGSIEVYTRKLFPFFSADDAIIYVNDFWKNLIDFRFIIPAGFLFSTRLPVRFLKKSGALCQKFLSTWQFSGLLFTVFTLALMTHFYISDFNEGTLCEKKYLPYCFIFSF